MQVPDDCRITHSGHFPVLFVAYLLAGIDRLGDKRVWVKACLAEDYPRRASCFRSHKVHFSRRDNSREPLGSDSAVWGDCEITKYRGGEICNV
jgi:hypothetical protein